MWDDLRPLLAGLDPVRIENLVGTGTPDVNYTEGWIELKYVARWPPRGGPLRIDHFTTEQRAWHIRRRKAGGKSYVLVKIGQMEWLLFDGLVAALYLGHEPRQRLYEMVVARWMRKPNNGELKSCLS